MPLVRINILNGNIAQADQTLAGLRNHVQALPKGAPVILMVHGYKFSPVTPGRDPHDHILSLAPSSTSWKAMSWPAALGVGAGAGVEPLCLAIGWEARSTPWRAYATAGQVGRVLGDLVNTIHDTRRDLRIGALAHSMGARVVLSALSQSRPGAMGRAILLAPAEMGRVAHDFLETPAGRAANVLCVTSRENAVFEQLLGWTIGPHRVFDRAIGHRGKPLHPRVTNLRIDDPTACAVLATMGYPLAPSTSRVCHWSVYLRGGLFPLYRAVLSGRLPIAALRAALPGQAAATLPLPPSFGPSCALPLPLGGKVSSS